MAFHKPREGNQNADRRLFRSQPGHQAKPDREAKTRRLPNLVEERGQVAGSRMPVEIGSHQPDEGPTRRQPAHGVPEACAKAFSYT